MQDLDSCYIYNFLEINFCINILHLKCFYYILPHRKGLCVCLHICVCTNCIISDPLQSFERANIDVCSMWAMVWSGTTQEGVVGRGSVDTNAHDPRFQRVPPRNSDFYSTSQSGSSATDDYLMFDVLLDGFYLQPKRENTTKHFIIFILQGKFLLPETKSPFTTMAML